MVTIKILKFLLLPLIYYNIYVYFIMYHTQSYDIILYCSKIKYHNIMFLLVIETDIKLMYCSRF